MEIVGQKRCPARGRQKSPEAGAPVSKNWIQSGIPRGKSLSGFPWSARDQRLPTAPGNQPSARHPNRPRPPGAWRDSGPGRRRFRAVPL